MSAGRTGAIGVAVHPTDLDALTRWSSQSDHNAVMEHCVTVRRERVDAQYRAENVIARQDDAELQGAVFHRQLRVLSQHVPVGNNCG